MTRFSGQRSLMKRRPNRRLYPRRRRYYRNKVNWIALAKKAYRGVRMLKGIVNSELNKVDTIIAATPTTTPGISLLTGLGEGTDVSQRIGNSILAKYLTYNIDASMNASASATHVRFIIFVDTLGTGTAPTAADLLEVSTNTQSPIKIDSGPRFIILRDIHFDLSINGDRIQHLKGYIPLNIHIKYTGASGGSVYKNAIYLYEISSEATNAPDANLYFRLAYYDN